MDKKDIENCPYVSYICGVPICSLNIAPCDKVDPKVCDCVEEGKDDAGKEIVHDCNQ